jgi:hypothetical protein
VTVHLSRHAPVGPVIPSRHAVVVIGAVAVVKRNPRAAPAEEQHASAARSSRIAAANIRRSGGGISPSYSSQFWQRALAAQLMLNFAGCANPAAAAGLNGFACRTLYDEKKQSTDSIATDVEKDFNGRVRD